MTEHEIDLIRKILLKGSTPIRAPSDWKQAEMLGAEAFEYLVTLLGAKALSGVEKVTALRLMSRISRARCTDLKPVLLRWAIALLADEDALVRSGAAHSAIAAFRALRTLESPSGRQNEWEPILRSALLGALGLGLGPREMVERFLASPTGARSNDSPSALQSGLVPELDRLPLPAALCTVVFSLQGDSPTEPILSGYDCWLHYVDDGPERGDFEVAVYFIGQREAEWNASVSALIAFADPSRQEGRCKPGARFELREISTTLATGVMTAVASRREPF